jgi:hypothetical protein
MQLLKRGGIGGSDADTVSTCLFVNVASFFSSCNFAGKNAALSVFQGAPGSTSRLRA